MTLAIIRFMELHLPATNSWLGRRSPLFTRQQSYWLFRPHALTTGLRRVGALDLQVVREYAGGLRPDESWMLGLPPRHPIWVREIIMSLDGVPSVFARSFTPLRASHGTWQGIRRLRTRPLADMLYHDSQVTRSRFAVQRLKPWQTLYDSVRLRLKDDCPAPHQMLVRCSVFWRDKQPLLVSECFLPDFWTLERKARESGNRPLSSF